MVRFLQAAFFTKTERPARRRAMKAAGSRPDTYSDHSLGQIRVSWVCRAGWMQALAAIIAIAAAAHCAQATPLPRIDPSGQHIFVWNQPPLSKYKPEPGKPTQKNMLFLNVAPAKIVAPVGAEVVLVGSICGPDGYMHANQRVEWMLAPGGVGQFVTLNERGFFDCLARPNEPPHKLDNSYAIGTTSARYVQLTRGTPTLDDDLAVQKGQAWVTVTSPVEGTSHVTAFAPSVYGWEQRKRTSTIYWVDAQWAFPPPANNPIGTRHVFATTLTRQTDRSPLVGWIVRYQIMGGPAAGFAPDGGQVVEATTNALGQATAEIFQQAPAVGTNHVAIQIIRPAELSGGYGQRQVIGHGSTVKTWSAAGNLTLRTMGPSQATIGSAVTFRVEVNNPGAISARQVVITNPLPKGLTFISSNPPTQPNGSGLEWRLGDIAAGQSQAIEIDFRADQAGTFTNCATLTGGDGVSAQSCATTTVTAAPVPVQSLSVTVTGPPTATVGQDVEFVAVVTNRGVGPAQNLTVVDRFDAGLQHTTSASPIERSLDPVQPGQSVRVPISLRVTQAGQLCNTVEVQDADRKVLGQSLACVNAAAAAAPPPTALPTLRVRKTGPARLTVGQTADFLIEITNTSQVPATQIRLSDNYDRGLEPKMANQGYTWVDNALVWGIDRLPPGQTVPFRVQCMTTAPAAKICNRATVTCREGATDNAEACLQIDAAAAAPAGPVGTARLNVTIASLVEPVAIGGFTNYQVKVTNSGQAADGQVTLVVTFPEQLTPQPTGTTGPPPSRPTILGKRVAFDAIPTLAPGETLSFQIQAKADQAGQAQIRAQVTSTSTPAGIPAEELTTVFAQ